MKTIKGIMMVAIAAVVCVFCGCSQDDDMYNDSDMYTLAEEMGTRSMGGDPGGNQGNKKKKIDFVPTPSVIPNPSKTSKSTDPTLYGEYDTDTLTVSISNFVGSAEISILTVESGYLMSSTTVAVSSESSIDFSLLDYPTSAYYQIFVTLGSDTYYGVFDL